jgi:hypothetical protein
MSAIAQVRAPAGVFEGVRTPNGAALRAVLPVCRAQVFVEHRHSGRHSGGFGVSAGR